VVVLSPVAVATQCASIAVHALYLIGSTIDKLLSLKADKHEKIRMLANSKLDSISEVISKALIDGYMDDEKLQQIISEITKFRSMKDKIRSNNKA
jgi:ribosomal protein S13